jgi:hypothetical protein
MVMILVGVMQLDVDAFVDDLSAFKRHDAVGAPGVGRAAGRTQNAPFSIE